MRFFQLANRCKRLYINQQKLIRGSMSTFTDQIRWLFTPRDKRKLLGLSLLMALSALLEMAGLGLLLGAAALFLSPQTPAAVQFQDFFAGLLPHTAENVRIMLGVGAIALLLAGKIFLPSGSSGCKANLSPPSRPVWRNGFLTVICGQIMRHSNLCRRSGVSAE
jgi:hypothetical protein